MGLGAIPSLPCIVCDFPVSWWRVLAFIFLLQPHISSSTRVAPLCGGCFGCLFLMSVIFMMLRRAIVHVYFFSVSVGKNCGTSGDYSSAVQNLFSLSLQLWWSDAPQRLREGVNRNGKVCLSPFSSTCLISQDWLYDLWWNRLGTFAGLGIELGIQHNVTESIKVCACACWIGRELSKTWAAIEQQHVLIFSELLDLVIQDFVLAQEFQCPPTRIMWWGQSGMWKWNLPG